MGVVWWATVQWVVDLFCYGSYIRLYGRFPVRCGCPLRLLFKGIYGFVGGLIRIMKNSLSLSLLENCCTSSFIWNMSMRDGLGQKERPLDNKLISLSERGTLETFTTMFTLVFSCSTLLFCGLFLRRWHIVLLGLFLINLDSFFVFPWSYVVVSRCMFSCIPSRFSAKPGFPRSLALRLLISLVFEIYMKHKKKERKNNKIELFPFNFLTVRRINGTLRKILHKND